jgi:hypothetical protein
MMVTPLVLLARNGPGFGIGGRLPYSCFLQASLARQPIRGNNSDVELALILVRTRVVTRLDGRAGG